MYGCKETVFKQERVFGISNKFYKQTVKKFLLKLY